MRTIVGVTLAGGLGALARHGLEGFVSRRAPSSFPWGTFVVNVTGAFLLGFLFTILSDRVAAAPWARSTLTIGFLGAYTTFSTLSLETFRLFEDGAYVLALANGLGSVILGLIAVFAGVVVGRVI